MHRRTNALNEKWLSSKIASVIEAVIVILKGKITDGHKNLHWEKGLKEYCQICSHEFQNSSELQYLQQMFTNTNFQ